MTKWSGGMPAAATQPAAGVQTVHRPARYRRRRAAHPAGTERVPAPLRPPCGHTPHTFAAAGRAGKPSVGRRHWHSPSRPAATRRPAPPPGSSHGVAAAAAAQQAAAARGRDVLGRGRLPAARHAVVEVAAGVTRSAAEQGGEARRWAPGMQAVRVGRPARSGGVGPCGPRPAALLAAAARSSSPCPGCMKHRALPLTCPRSRCGPGRLQGVGGWGGAAERCTGGATAQARPSSWRQRRCAHQPCVRPAPQPQPTRGRPHGDGLRAGRRGSARRRAVSVALT